MSSGFLHRISGKKLKDVSDVHASSTIRAKRLYVRIKYTLYYKSTRVITYFDHLCQQHILSEIN